jgi:hypothetical protein
MIDVSQTEKIIFWIAVGAVVCIVFGSLLFGAL